MPDPAANSRLRLAIQNARAENLPKDNIDRAIKKAAGGDAETYDAVRYEGYGPGGVAVIVEALTDNRNRTASNVRSLFAKYGGNLGETGSVAFMFTRAGEIVYPAAKASADAMLEAAIDAGADDVVSDDDRPHHHLRLREYRRGVLRACRQVRRCRNGEGRVEAADHDAGRPGKGRDA